jgi:tellurite resistance protein
MSLSNIFDDIIGGMTKEEAFLAVLSAAVMIDGEKDGREAEELEALTRRSRTLAALKPNEAAAFRAKIEPRLTKDKINELVSDACASLKQEKPDVALSLLAHCCDIIFADQHVRTEERTFLQALIAALAIPEQDAEMILRALKIKNAH